jgi:hypothetical protein
MFSPTAPTRPRWADRARRALDSFVAFATLADAEPAPHPHRRPLRSPLAATARRPGVPQPRAQICRSPVRAAAPARRVERRV